MKTVLLWAVMLIATAARSEAADRQPHATVTASWYGEAHRGRIMANGKRFNPDKLTAASWFYPLGKRVRVTLNFSQGRRRSVLVKITDRGPAYDLVRDGRTIDLSEAAFRQLASPDIGLVPVKIEPLR
jgi:rare lipoprotein A